MVEAEPPAHERRVLAGRERRGDEDRGRPVLPQALAQLAGDSTGAHASASGSAQTTRSSSPASRHDSTCAERRARGAPARRDLRPVRRARSPGRRVRRRGRAPAPPAPRAAVCGPPRARPHAAAARPSARRGRPGAPAAAAGLPAGAFDVQREPSEPPRGRPCRRATTPPIPRAGAPRRTRRRRAPAAPRRRTRRARSRARDLRSRDRPLPRDRARPRRNTSRRTGSGGRCSGRRPPRARPTAPPTARAPARPGRPFPSSSSQPCIASHARASRPSAHQERLEALQLAAADVVLAALQHRYRQLTAERPRCDRHVLVKELLLQRLGRGRDDHALSGLERRQQVGKALPDAGAGLGDEVLPGRECPFDGTRRARPARAAARTRAGRGRARHRGRRPPSSPAPGYAIERMFPPTMTTSHLDIAWKFELTIDRGPKLRHSPRSPFRPEKGS